MRLPESSACINAFGQFECLGIELENREVGEDVAVSIEEAVVEDAFALAEYPLPVGPVIGLCGLALDLIPQSVLPLVHLGQVEVFQHKHAGASNQRRQHNGEGDS